ncbi:AP-2 complex subunit alpha [Cryptococcus gattii E566]|uniref:AP-2 complex subunit alpha n=2 Tax=Cryptococcus gattii TaxID=37769 RepID=E6RA00_CRYGW|nr:Vesicle-mediated transport-related protein, putative [Cryptococcus gattii WM276]ADV23640.1 Vesicle-mediated transport-related protein, putative [Cryptococcus gattii WM276]KIR77740.1 AP-2 complex subunit alpha [Cryptococcus gattii EJB2]KIY36046.1 AP-2 complex subunit alpha [Cryptococcus gattii E566]KJE05544.1 AP-2 complex subunit alpha [Cryptococcus gattii NT-10]
MATQMRGLTQYISDLRACRVRELEEKRINREMAHIRQKFKDGNLDGYQKKKYLAKVVFTYILGYKVDVGHMEAINLISSQKYSEKQIGYLALTLLMHENSDLARLVINSLRKDLEDQNEVNNCLALHAIATLGGKEMAESLAESVYRSMISATSSTFVKKKAALTLLRLYRKHPSVMPIKEWAARIVSMMGDRDPGVVLTVTALVTTMAQAEIEAFSGSYQKAVDILDRIVFEGHYPAEYIYYKVPNPWLQIKLLRLLQYYPPPGTRFSFLFENPADNPDSVDNPQVVEMVNAIIQAIIDSSQDTPRNIQHNNAQNAVLFESINLAIHIDPSSDVVRNASVLLGRFILAKETNVRYLGLDAMAHLAATSNSLEAVKKHQNIIIQGLKDRDISVRRRALDLLYSMCDTSNAKVIVGELVRYLQVADYNLREDMVLKIAILTERFATEYEWYVDTILQLIAAAGDHVGAEVWYRVVQLVVNNEGVQDYAVRAVYKHLQATACHENMIRVGGYIMGEFGHLIANDPGSSPIEQFQALHSKVNLCTAPTRALLLSTYIKWVNLFPEIKEHLINIFERYTHVLDAELQQRACEYLALARRPESDGLLATICDEMPVFPERESALLSRLHRKGEKAQDKRTWVIGGKEENTAREAERFKAFRRGTGDSGGILSGSPAPASAPPSPAPETSSTPQRHASAGTETMMGIASSGPSEDILSSLADLELTGSHVQNQPLLTSAPTGAYSQELAGLHIQPTGAGGAPLPGGQVNGSNGINGSNGDAKGLAYHATLGGVNPALLAPLTVADGVEKWFERLSFSNEGVLYEDTFIQIGVKAEYHGHLGRIALFFGNKADQPFTSFSALIDNPSPSAINIHFHDAPVGEISAKAQIQEMIHVECREVFFHEGGTPLLRLSFLVGEERKILVLKLPVFLSKFAEGVHLESGPFFERWKIIGGPPREAQLIFPIKLTANGTVDIGRNQRIITGNKLSVLPDIDHKPENIVFAGVLHMSSAGKVGILGRMEPNKDAKLCRLTVRSTNEHVSAEILSLTSKPLSTDVAASL